MVLCADEQRTHASSARARSLVRDCTAAYHAGAFGTHALPLPARSPPEYATLLSGDPLLLTTLWPAAVAARVAVDRSAVPGRRGGPDDVTGPTPFAESVPKPRA